MVFTRLDTYRNSCTSKLSDHHKKAGTYKYRYDIYNSAIFGFFF